MVGVGPASQFKDMLVSALGELQFHPTVATSEFASFYALGRVLRCHLRVAGGRSVHLVVCCGFLGAATDSEKSKLTERLLDSVLCEWAVVETSMLTTLRFPVFSRVLWLVIGLIFRPLGVLLLVLIPLLLASMCLVLMEGPDGTLFFGVLWLLLLCAGVGC